MRSHWFFIEYEFGWTDRAERDRGLPILGQCTTPCLFDCTSHSKSTVENTGVVVDSHPSNWPAGPFSMYGVDGLCRNLSGHQGPFRDPSTQRFREPAVRYPAGP